MKNSVLKICVVLFFSLIITFLLEKFYFVLPFSLYRDIVIFSIAVFIFLHFIIDLNKLYSFIYRRRYVLALILLSIIVLFKLNGTSINYWDKYIQPNYYKPEFQSLIGTPRSIRSDEWVVASTIDLSQSKLSNKFSSTNNITRAEDTQVSLITRSPVKDISILVNIFKIGYLFLGNEMGISLWWYGRLLALFLITFEFLLLITRRNKKISLLGAILITFSPVIQWWFSTQIVDILIYGEAAILVFNAFLNTQSRKKRILLSILFGIIGASYICCYYPPWQVSFGYVFFAMIVWLLYDYRFNLKLSDLLYLLISLFIIAILVGWLLYKSSDALNIILNTAYPGKRSVVGGTGWNLLFTYFSSFLYSFKDLGNPCENSQFISLFPLSLFLAIFLVFKNYKNKHKDILLLLLTITSIVLLIWNFVKLPEIISKVTLLSFSTPQRSQVTIGYIMIILLVYISSKYAKNVKFDKRISFLISFVAVMYGMTMIDKLFPSYLTTWYISTFSITFFLIMYMILKNLEKYNIYVLIILSAITLISGICINPINRGLDVLYEKPLAKKVQSITKKDPDAKWMVVSNYYLIPNYLVANGARTINSVNVYPNLNLWRKFDKEGLYEEVYNRYMHILINMIDSDSYYEHVEGYDLIRLNMNYDDLIKTNVKYILSDRYLDDKLIKTYDMQLLYDDNNMIIYKVSYVDVG